MESGLPCYLLFFEKSSQSELALVTDASCGVPHHVLVCLMFLSFELLRSFALPTLRWHLSLDFDVVSPFHLFGLHVSSWLMVVPCLMILLEDYPIGI